MNLRCFGVSFGLSIRFWLEIEIIDAEFIDAEFIDAEFVGAEFCGAGMAELNWLNSGLFESWLEMVSGFLLFPRSRLKKPVLEASLMLGFEDLGGVEFVLVGFGYRRTTVSKVFNGVELGSSDSDMISSSESVFKLFVSELG